MAAFMIGYDLNKSGKDYAGVYQGIKDASDGTWCHFLDSTWFIRTTLTPDQIFAKIEPHLTKTMYVNLKTINRAG